MGMTGYFQKTDKRLEPGTSAYRRIYPQGNHFGGASVDYGYEAYRWSVRGETAYGGTLLDFATDPVELRGANKRNGLATLNCITWIASPRYRLTAIQRYYNHNYYSFYSRALSENSGVQNETGGLIRLDASPVDGIQMAAYMDVFYNPWPRYGLQRSSFGWEGMAEAEYAISRRNSLNIRYNVKQKDQVETKTKTQYAVTDHRLRLQWQRTSYSNEWQVKASLMLHAREGSLGKAIGGTCRYKDKKSRCQVAASGVYFHTNDYNSRIFMFEPNVSEMANFPSFYGHGIHGTAVLRGYLWKRMLSLELKYGVTRYFDRETQGSGLQTIYSNVKNDLTLQARLRI